MRQLSILIISSFCFLGTKSALCLDLERDDGLLRLRSQGLGQLFRYNPLPYSHRGFKPGSVQAHWQKNYASLWGYERKYIVDAQTTDDILALSLGVPGNMKVEFLLGQRKIQPSGMDGITTGFHDLFKIPQDERLNVEQDRNLVTIPSYSIQVNDDHRGTIYSQTQEIRLAHQLKSDAFDLILGAAASQEMASTSPRAKDAVDFGLQAQANFRQRSSALAYQLAAYWNRFSSNSQFEQGFRSEQFIVNLGSSWSYSANTSTHLQATIAEAVFRDLGQFSRESYEVQAGVRHRFKSLVVQAALIENIIWPYNTPDWGFNLALGYSFE